MDYVDARVINIEDNHYIEIYIEPMVRIPISREGANKRGNSSRLTQSFHFFMFEPIFFSRKCLESAYLDRFFAI